MEDRNTDFYFPAEGPEKLSYERYNFDVDKNLHNQWKNKDKNSTITTEDIIKKSFVWLFDMIEKRRRNEMADRQKRGY